MYKVMIVDDEPFIIEGLKVLINWEGYGFTICSTSDNGEDAVKQAKECLPDLIITDIRMPEMDGIDLIKRCKEELKLKCKFIVLSGYGEFELARKAMQYGVSNYILKPIDEDEIIKSLRKVKQEIDIENINIDYNLILNKFFKRILNGEIDKSRLDKMKVYLPECESQAFRYVIYQVADKKAAKPILLNIIGKSMASYIIEEKCGIGLIVTEKLIKKCGSNILVKILDEISNKLEQKAAAYISTQVNGISQIKSARDQCIIRMNVNFFIETYGVIYCSEHEEESLKYGKLESNIIDELLEHIERGNLDKIEEDVNNIYDEFKCSNIAPEVIKATIINFKQELLKIIDTMNGNVDDLSKSIEHVEEKVIFLKDICEEVKLFCVEACKYIKILRSKSKSGIMQDVEEYIKAHYAEDLKLKTISEHFFMNSVYLGQMFKKNFNISFNDYLNRIRIEKAKELLRKDEYKIWQISSLVGYNDCNYFINKFEKIVGCTPVEYKKAI